MGDMNSAVHSYCDGFAIVQNAPDDFSLRMIKEGGTDSIKVIRRTGPTAAADIQTTLAVFRGILELQGCDV
jgi:hypothetical protein